MAKDKKKHSKKEKLADDVLDVAAVSLKKFRRVTRQITKLSTGQKLAGGVALLAAGLTYLARKQATDNETFGAPPVAADLADPQAEFSASEVAVSKPTDTPGKSKKSTKTK